MTFFALWPHRVGDHVYWLTLISVEQTFRCDRFPGDYKWITEKMICPTEGQE